MVPPYLLFFLAAGQQVAPIGAACGGILNDTQQVTGDESDA
jgi:hypothetical protein